VAALAALIPATSAAAAWPERPVKLVVPFAAGGITDVLARITAERLRLKLNQPFVVENTAGGAGTVAAQRVARADPDGYTLFFCTTNQVAVAPFTHNIAYDPIKDFKAVSIVGITPYVFTVNDKVPSKTMAEFITYVKANQGKVTYGSSGTGSLSHIATAHFAKSIGADMAQVAYRGIAPAFQDLLAGHIALLAPTPVELRPQLGSGKLRPLASTDNKRSAALPDVPAIVEVLPNSPPIVTWQGILAPRATPQPIVDAISQVVMAAGRDPEFTQQLAKIGIEPVVQTPEEFAKYIAAELDRYRVVVRDVGLKPPK
jgi:tripartite-type tricarboxylate transporter receptor subunit TctC